MSEQHDAILLSSKKKKRREDELDVRTFLSEGLDVVFEKRKKRSRRISILEPCDSKESLFYFVSRKLGDVNDAGGE